MEKTKLVCYSFDVGWSDIGSWSSIWDISNKDNEGNVKIATKNIESNNNYLRSRTSSCRHRPQRFNSS